MGDSSTSSKMSLACESIISGVIGGAEEGISAEAALLAGAFLVMVCLLVERNTRGSKDVALLVTIAPGDGMVLF